VANTEENRARDFLASEGMLYEAYDFESLVKGFLKEMERGLLGKNSSLAMIPTYYSVPKKLPEEKTAVVIDAGGTRLRRGVIRPSDPFPDIKDYRETCMPGTKGAVSKDEFIRTLADFVLPVTDSSRPVGFCFSYPTRNNAQNDARVISMTKELRIRGIINAYIGKELMDCLREKGKDTPTRIAVLNDSTALLLSGRYEERKIPDQAAGILNIGYILGTGINCCYQEPNENIVEVLEHLKARDQIINMEAGGFDDIPRGAADEALDNKTTSRSSYTLEKMTAGAYLGPLFLEVLRRGAAGRLFGRTSCENIREWKALETKDLSEFLEKGHASSTAALFTDTSELSTARHLALMLMERAALVAAIPIAGVIARSFLTRGEASYSSVFVSAEGSTLFKVPEYEKRMLGYVREFTKRSCDINIQLQEIRNGSLLGAGIAAVSGD